VPLAELAPQFIRGGDAAGSSADDNAPSHEPTPGAQLSLLESV
jgi:hypothetical protein